MLINQVNTKNLIILHFQYYFFFLQFRVFRQLYGMVLDKSAALFWLKGTCKKVISP